MGMVSVLTAKQSHDTPRSRPPSFPRPSKDAQPLFAVQPRPFPRPSREVSQGIARARGVSQTPPPSRARVIAKKLILLIGFSIEKSSPLGRAKTVPHPARLVNGYPRNGLDSLSRLLPVDGRGLQTVVSATAHVDTRTEERGKAVFAPSRTSMNNPETC